MDYRTAADRVRDWVGLWRRDRRWVVYWIQYLHTCVLLIVCRCGAEYPLPDNSGPTQCDPNSENFCCSKWGYCGGDGEHCGCPECVNYRDNK